MSTSPAIKKPNLFFESLCFRIDEDNLPVRAEQLRARMKLFPTIMLSQLLIEPSYVWLLWDSPSVLRPHLLLWLGSAYLIHLAQFIRWYSHRNNLDTVAQCQEWSRYSFLFALVMGMMWGFGTLIFMPPDLPIQMVLICIMLGLVAGAVATDSTHPPAFYAYTLGLMLPLTFRILVEQDSIHFALSILLALFLLVALVSGHFLGKRVLLSLQRHFENQLLAQQLATLNSQLEQKIEERTAQLRHKTEEVAHIRDVTIIALGTLAETRDNETANHLKRTQHYIRALANHLRDHPRYRDFLSEENIDALYKLAPLHDIGKVGIPDHILLKAGKLTNEEFEIMKKHPALGGDVLVAAESSLPAPSRFLHIARDIATGHHEKWDGSGFPSGLRGDSIPMPARLMAVADVYDALISQRAHKEAFTHEDAMDKPGQTEHCTHEDAVAAITRARGTHFDPDVISAFLAIQEEFRQIAEQYRDAPGAA
ncbi:MAG: HD domain-containing phosphohydrolase [Gallionellaceae bacterium]|jgi:response regulator RpfG family c-di-GMP phosphodiesterase